MARAVGTVALLVVGIWLVAHVLLIGPVESAAETTLMWILGMAAASVAVAGAVLLAVGLVLGRTQPAWLNYVRFARTGAVVLGCLIVVVGLLHYRNTEPRGEILWVVLGLAVLVAAAGVSWWLAREERRA
ncbi:MAG TPA: hypothetical protein VHZ49_04810 [Methylomirabilota bacterium]|jgi:hypothetical protein|nr:hypothetical protein [Methylomirabilota bacterium]